MFRALLLAPFRGLAVIWPRLYEWLAWSVLLGTLVPVGLLYISLSWHAHRWAALNQVLGHGEPFLLGSFLLVANLQFLRKSRQGGFGDFLLVATIVIVLIGIVSWSSIVGQQDGALNPKAAAQLADESVTLGLWFLGLSVVCGSVSVAAFNV